jgi:hypothetical protein
MFSRGPRVCTTEDVFDPEPITDLAMGSFAGLLL